MVCSTSASQKLVPYWLPPSSPSIKYPLFNNQSNALYSKIARPGLNASTQPPLANGLCVLGCVGVAGYEIIDQVRQLLQECCRDLPEERLPRGCGAGERGFQPRRTASLFPLTTSPPLPDVRRRGIRLTRALFADIFAGCRAATLSSMQVRVPELSRRRPSRHGTGFIGQALQLCFGVRNHLRIKEITQRRSFAVADQVRSGGGLSATV